MPDDFISADEVIKLATKTTYSKQATKLGFCKSLDLVVYEIKHNSKNDPRVGLSKEAFRMLFEEWQSRALVLFVPENNASNYRFSLIEIKLEGDQTSAEVHRRYSNPRRYSYLLGEGTGGYTPNKYLAKGKIRDNDEKDLLERFSVEVLTKAFYNELSDWYAWAIDMVEFPGEQLIDTDDRRTEHRSKNVIRLLTRLLFVWFLKQKDLIPWQLFDENYLNAYILKDFNPNHKTGIFSEKSQESKYYRAILQNLFFATLNCPITPQSKEDSRERGFRKSDYYGQGFGEDHLMRYENEFTNAKHFLELVNERVPFLNGGLFDCLDDKQNQVYIDGFSDNLKKPNRLKVPDSLFFGESQGKGQDVSSFYGDKKKKSTDILGLVDILKKYNFTIEENTPFDQEVSLDPELLGKVFENLLASYNPETKTTARKQTGSFYTPREIVQYMVDESLVAHLKRTVGEDLEEEYRKLMRYTDEEPQLTDEKRLSIIQSLQNCKVLDPACGSGAFPVGVLQQMVHILSQLDPHNELWKNLILDVAINELSSTLKECTTEERDEIQADINRNFDDSVNRPDYARKLYLIENCIYGVDIQSIAVQISKLRFFISLVVDQKPTQDQNDNFGIRPLPNLEAKFVAANTLIGLKKERTLFDDDEIDKLEAKLTQASHRIFGAKSNKMKNKYKARVEELQAQIAERLETLGVVGNEDARLMRDWKMFDQNASSPFFDPEWMFGVSGGFDIVIGNPPYGVSIKGAYRKDVEKSIGRVPDYEIYYYFIQIAHRLLTNCGILSYIIPNTYLFNTFADKYRISLLEKWSLLEILDCSKFPVFESATVLNTINTWQKSESTLIGYRNTSDANSFRELSAIPKSIISKDDLLLMNQNWGLAFRLNTQTILLIQKIKRDRDCLSSKYAVSQGYIPYRKTDLIQQYGKDKGIEIVEKRLWHSSCKINNEYIQEIFGRDIDKFSYTKTDSFVWYGKHLACYVDMKFFCSQRILVREITNPTIIACIVNETMVNDPQLLSIIPKDDEKLLVLWAILNSKLATFFHFNHAPKATKGAFPKILVKDLKEFPIPSVSVEEEVILNGLVDKILETKKADRNADTTAIEREIDLMVYKLYGLSYDEVLTIDPKTPITQQQYEPASDEARQSLYETMGANYSKLLPTLCDAIYTVETLEQVDTSQIKSENERIILMLGIKLIRLQVFCILVNLDISSFLRANFRTQINAERRCNLKYLNVITTEGYNYLISRGNHEDNGIINKTKEVTKLIGDNELTFDILDIEQSVQNFGINYINRYSRNLSIHYDQNPIKVYDDLESVEENTEIKKVNAFLGILGKIFHIVKKYATKYNTPQVSAKDHYKLKFYEAINVFPDVDNRLFDELAHQIDIFTHTLNSVVSTYKKSTIFARKQNLDTAFLYELQPLIENIRPGIHIHFIYLDLSTAIRAYLSAESYFEKQLNLRRVNIVVYEGFKHIYGFTSKDHQSSFWKKQIYSILEKTADQQLIDSINDIETELKQIATNSDINNVTKREHSIHYRYKDRDNTIPLFQELIESNPIIEIGKALIMINILPKLFKLNSASLDVIYTNQSDKIQLYNNDAIDKLDLLLAEMAKSVATPEQKQSIIDNTEKLKNLLAMFKS